MAGDKGHVIIINIKKCWDYRFAIYLYIRHSDCKFKKSLLFDKKENNNIFNNLAHPKTELTHYLLTDIIFLKIARRIRMYFPEPSDVCWVFLCDYIYFNSPSGAFSLFKWSRSYIKMLTIIFVFSIVACINLF